MEKLFSAAQRRVRMIARLIAETLVKDAFLNLHGEIRDHCQHEARVRRGGKWVAVNPASWSARNDMTIEVGLGSGGREQEIMALKDLIGMQMSAVEGQAAGMIKLPLVTEQQLYNSARRYSERIGMKAPELFWQDPEEVAQQMAAAGSQEEQPDPEMMKVQADAAAAEQKIKLMREEAAAKLELRKQEAEAEMQLEERLAVMRAQLEERLALQKMRSEVMLAREKQQLEAQMGVINGAQQAAMSGYRPGGDLDK